MASAGLIYLIIAFIASMVVPTGSLAGSDVALLEVVRQGFLAFPGWLFAIIACIAVTNTCLVALITNSRIMYGMADTGIRESVVVVCLVMLLIGVGLYFVNNLAQRRLDPALRRSGREGGS